MKAINIILPVYKVEHYILKCLSSINSQTFKDFSVIIVDDCGNDKSIALAKTFLSKTDIDYLIVRNETNQGVSECRNAGIKAATADYIMFVDPDDWIEQTMLEELYKAATIFNADIIACNGVEYWEKENVYKPLPSIGGGYEPEQYLTRLFNRETTAHMWLRMIKRNLFHDIMFPKDVIFEDFLILPYLIEKANFVVHLDRIFYTYVQRANHTNITASKPMNVVGFIEQLKIFDSHFTKNKSCENVQHIIKYEFMLLSFILSRLLKSAAKYREIKAEVNVIRSQVSFSYLFKVNRVVPKRVLLLLLLVKMNGRFVHLFLKRYRNLKTDIN